MPVELLIGVPNHLTGRVLIGACEPRKIAAYGRLSRRLGRPKQPQSTVGCQHAKAAVSREHAEAISLPKDTIRAVLKR